MTEHQANSPARLIQRPPMCGIGCQLLPEPFLYRRHQPVMSRVGVDQDHHLPAAIPKLAMCRRRRKSFQQPHARALSSGCGTGLGAGLEAMNLSRSTLERTSRLVTSANP